MINYFFYIFIFLIFLILPVYTFYITRKNKFFRPISFKKQILNNVFTINISIILIIVVYIVYVLKTGLSLIRNNNIENVLKNFYSISEAYIKENREKIINDSMIIARTLSSQRLNFFENKRQIQDLIESYASLKELSDIVVFVPSQNIILAKNNLGFSLVFETLPSSYLLQSSKEKPVVIEDLEYLKIKALIELEGFPFQTYLMISRSLDSKITNYILENRDALSSYEKIKKNIDRMQNIFFIVFILVVFVSVFIIRFLVKIISDQLVKPINDFVFLTSEKNIENVDLSLLKEKKTNIIELNILINAFNSIIEKLNNSKREIDEHNNFINAIFSQTPYGLFIFNIFDSKIVMENDATNKLLLDNISNLKNLFITKINALILEKLNNKDIFEESFELTELKSGKNYTFLVKIIRANFSYLEKSNTKNENKYFLIIFNDITEHISYQRNLLWIDVAKRITHEIRNPLTPILLSVERLEYKFTDSIEENNRDRFLKYLENIKKHTLTISNIIDEFIEFGKMPEPEFHEKNLNKIILETIEGSYFDRNMKYELNLFEENDFKKMNFIADEKQIMRVLLNIFKNSFESFVEKKISSESLIIKIQTFFDEKENLVLEIEDNGPGFPSNLIEKMTEPYVTTKKKGSGLGLSIVKRIISDHNGSIFFENIFDSNGFVLGARILIKFLKR